MGFRIETPFSATQSSQRYFSIYVQSILTDSLSQVFGCNKLQKKDLEIYIINLLTKGISLNYRSIY